MQPQGARQHPTLRQRDGQHARVTYEELFFDLVYAFAVTQLSHKLLHQLDVQGLVQSLILWFAVWLGWQYTCWVTNWFDPQTPRIRGLLFATMVLALCMAGSIPQAFGERAWVFAACYAVMQVGRTAFIVWELGPVHALAANYRRMLGWLCIAAVFWLAGAWAEGQARMALWLLAIACEYFSPMVGFALPGLGRSRTSDWTIEGGHLAERCQAFVIVALGETLVASAGELANAALWTAPVLLALGATLTGTLAMWWLYFGTSSEDASAAITTSPDPGRMGAYLHYIHAILVAGVIGSAVGNDLVMARPLEGLATAQVLALVGGPAAYLLGSAVYKRVVYRRIPLSHLAGALALLALIPAGYACNLLAMGWLTTAVLVGVVLWEALVSRRGGHLVG